MAKKKVFVSFDYENDKHYKFLLEAWHNNPYFEFTFNDYTPTEIYSYNIDRIKAGLTLKLKQADYTLVIVGKEANKIHKDHRLIGHRNWINFEIYQSKLYSKKLVAVKLDRSFESPDELSGSGASWAWSFTQDAIIDALRKA